MVITLHYGFVTCYVVTILEGVSLLLWHIQVEYGQLIVNTYHYHYYVYLGSCIFVQIKHWIFRFALYFSSRLPTFN
jgi:hypothetical protein